jgi:hypothetical protein
LLFSNPRDFVDDILAINIGDTHFLVCLINVLIGHFRFGVVVLLGACVCGCWCGFIIQYFTHDDNRNNACTNRQDTATFVLQAVEVSDRCVGVAIPVFGAWLHSHANFPLLSTTLSPTFFLRGEPSCISVTKHDASTADNHH